jgi:hypothetical protein
LLLAALAGAYSLLVTLLLVIATRSGEVVLAVDPFKITAWPFQAAGRLFPQYTWWSEQTIIINAAWLIVGIAATAGVAWYVYRDSLRTALAKASRSRAARVARHRGAS